MEFTSIFLSYLEVCYVIESNAFFNADLSIHKFRDGSNEAMMNIIMARVRSEVFIEEIAGFIMLNVPNET
jgi:hypothetical protein